MFRMRGSLALRRMAGWLEGSCVQCLAQATATVPAATATPQISACCSEDILRIYHSFQNAKIWCAGTTPILKKRSENAGVNENLSGGFAAIPGIAPRVAPRIVGFVLIKSWEAIPRIEFRIPRMEFPIPRAAPRIPRNSPRAPRMAFSLRERFSWNWGGPQASEKNWDLDLGKRKHTLPCSSAELVFAEKMGATEERFRWSIWLSCFL